MKIVGTLLLVGGLIGGILMIVFGLSANNEYKSQYSSYWVQADKSSTIVEKSAYIDKFVDALSHAHLEGQNDALWYKNNTNSFDKNFEALKTLQTRLQEIKTMDVNSFAYQTAIQQITAQEQGQAQEMLSAIEGCWWKVNHYFFWNDFLEILSILFIFASLIIGGILMFMDND